MLKPSIKSVEGISFLVILVNAIGMLWYIVMREPFDYEQLMVYAKSAEDISAILKFVVEEQTIDWTKLGEMGGLGGFAAFAFQYFTNKRSKLKQDELQYTGANEPEEPQLKRDIKVLLERLESSKERKIE
jgi:hypothetical protein